MRPEVGELTPAQWRRFVEAVRTAHTRGDTNRLVLLHLDNVTSPHRGAGLPWPTHPGGLVAWYRSGNGTYLKWTVNQWIKTNSGICGAYT